MSPACQSGVIRLWRHGGVSARLLVSLSGITTRTLDQAAALTTELDYRPVPLTVLLTPRVAGEDQPESVLDWVRDRVAAGAALLQHGFDPADARSRRRAERREWSGPCLRPVFADE